VGQMGQEKLKIHTIFQFEFLSGKCTLGNIGLNKMLKTR
jgi:hypothetical protein